MHVYREMEQDDVYGENDTWVLIYICNKKMYLYNLQWYMSITGVKLLNKIMFFRYKFVVSDMILRLF